MPGRKDMPRTIRRSPAKAQHTWEKAHDSAVHTYGEGEAAHRVAYAALKHGFEKVGDHWEPKARRGPSDPRAATPTARAIRGEGETFRGVDYLGHTREELVARARGLGLQGTSRMNKRDLARAIARRQK